MISWNRRTVALTALGVAVVAAVAATVALVLPAGPSKPLSKPSTPPPVTASASPAAQQLTSPFTGERVRSLHRVLAVKIDNIIYARPQTGLTRADIVYVLPVEGGLSRFFAVFSSHYPPVIGPVRSAREDDLPLLRQFRRPAFAYSGAQPQLLPVVEHARTVDLWAGHAAGYFRDNSRQIPDNLYARTKTLLAQAKHASKAHDIGFRFGPPPPGGRSVKARSVSYGAASFGFRWSRGAGRWKISMDGSRAMSTEDGQLSAPTVVIQYTRVRTSRFIEWPGIRPPFAVTKGSGRAVVLRDGKEWKVHWSRPVGGKGTTFTTAGGQRMTFSRGPVWVVFAAA